MNKVILVGNLGKDVELRHTADGTACASFSLGTNKEWKDDNGVKQSACEWHQISAFKQLAEACHQYLRKGSRVYIEGYLKTRKWTDQQNIERWSTGIVVQELRMLDGRQENQTPEHSRYNENGTQKSPMAQPCQQAQQPQPGTGATPADYDPYEIPF